MGIFGKDAIEVDDLSTMKKRWDAIYRDLLEHVTSCILELKEARQATQDPEEVNLGTSALQALDKTVSALEGVK